jgi:hypothetical protein
VDDVGPEPVDGAEQRVHRPHVAEIGRMESGALPRRLRRRLVEAVRPRRHRRHHVVALHAERDDADLVAPFARAG